MTTATALSSLKCAVAVSCGIHIGATGAKTMVWRWEIEALAMTMYGYGHGVGDVNNNNCHVSIKYMLHHCSGRRGKEGMCGLAHANAVALIDADGCSGPLINWLCTFIGIVP